MAETPTVDDIRAKEREAKVLRLMGLLLVGAGGFYIVGTNAHPWLFGIVVGVYAVLSSSANSVDAKALEWKVQRATDGTAIDVEDS